MDYEVFVTDDAEQDLDEFLWYLLTEKKSEQSAKNLLNDYQETLNELALVAGSLTPCKNDKLASLGYHRINFLHHNYFMLYRIEGHIAIVDNVFHGLQDYEKHLENKGVIK